MEGQFVLLVLLVTVVTAQNSCTRTPVSPEVMGPKTSGDNDYAISIAGRSAAQGYIPGQVYTVTLNGSVPNRRFSGFYLVAVPEKANDETTTLGNFQHFPNPALTKFDESCPQILTHTYSLVKDAVSVMWTAPPTGSGCVEFRATVIEDQLTWFKDDGALTKLFCEDQLAGGLQGERREGIPECCACGIAKYHMVFMGNWSRYTHPKDFPTYQQLLHWSNIVGASHSRDYMLWKYGGMATKGVKEVCEYGSVRMMEREIKEHGRSVRTVIKTPGIWVNLLDTRWARFTVNRTHHLMSMLSMLGPSPDWCVGVSALNLCLPNCTWADDQKIELYPWDAGTDSGVTYMSPNHRTDPQERIHRLTNEFPPNPRSPFYGSEPIKPLATLLIKRLHPKLATECVEDTLFQEDPEPLFVEEDEDELSPEDAMRRRAMEAGKCVTSDWSDWTPCNVLCGLGRKSRTRRFIMPGITPAMCPPTDLEQKENCIGKVNVCDYSQVCSTSAWSEWSPCSVTCGKGTQTTTRALIREDEMPQCSHLLFRKTQDCVKMSCAEHEAQRNYTSICSLPKLVGRCRGSFLKWYWDVQMKSCLPFHYGGCRGNENRFSTREKCMLMCREFGPMEGTSSPTRGFQEVVGSGQRVDCIMSPWSDYGPCSRTCGRGYATKSRIITRPAANGGRPCSRRLIRRRRCQIQKCPVDCELGEWSEWEPCMKTCGDAIQTRVKPTIQRARHGGAQCTAPRLEKRYCSLPMCLDEATLAPAVRYQQFLMDPPSDSVRYGTTRRRRRRLEDV